MNYQRRQRKKIENVTFLTIPKGNDMQLKFGYSDFGGVHRLDIRQWVRVEQTGKMIPTKSGLSIPISEIDSFMNTLAKVIPQVIAHMEKKNQANQEWFEDLSGAEEVGTLNPEDLKGDDQWG